MIEGWIKLHRKMLDWEWMGNPEMGWLWINLLLRANREDKEWQGITVKRGQVLTSVARLSEMVGQTNKQIRGNLERLQRANQVAIETTNRYSIITICNYDAYQGCDTDEGQAEGQATGQTKGKPEGKQRASQRATTKEDKKKEILSTTVNTSVDSTKKVAESEDFRSFRVWILNHAPEVAKMQQPFTEAQYQSLQQNYTSREVAEVLEDMSNSANLLKKYKSAYLTCKSWLKMRRERRGGMPMAQPQRKPSKVENMIRTLTEMGIDPNDTRTPLV